MYTAGSSDEPYEGYRADGDYPYWYKAVFKVKVNKETVGHEGFEIVIKCVDNDWLSRQSESMHLSKLMRAIGYIIAKTPSFRLNCHIIPMSFMLILMEFGFHNALV